MSKLNEIKFYQSLENIFTGAEIEGDSGYVNLLKIKSKYYKIILEQFKKDVDNEPIITDSFKEEFFDKLYSFFEKYFSESGSVYFVKTANWQRVYEQVYTDNKDVVLFWKTHMLYYVKSDILFQSIDVNIVDDESKQEYNFFFDVGNLQAKQNNEKKALIFTFKEVKEEKTSEEVLNNKQGKKIFVFDVSYSEKGTKTKTDDIIKATKIPEHIIEKAFATFKKQSEVDFFINKNAEKFLAEQLDMYLHQILLNEENKFEQKRLDQLKTIKIFALKIIKFIAQFEDELVRVWNKPKFALNSNYVITIDKLSDEIIGKIAKHENLQEQIKEWQELGMVDEGFDFAKRSEKENFLPIDTKHFKDLEIEILSLFDNLDEALDGRLIHSENYQALNTLSEKYKEKVQCIYIDPPYNTNDDGFIYNDKFQSASWLTFIDNRISIAKKLLTNNGLFYSSIASNAKYYHESSKLDEYLYEIFSQRLGEIIWQRRSGSGSNTIKGITEMHEKILCYGNENSEIYKNILTSEDLKKYKYKDDKGIYKWNETVINQYTKTTRPNLFYAVFYDEKNDKILFKKESDDLIEIYPSSGNSVFFCDISSMKEIKERNILKVFKENNKYILRIKKYLYNDDGTINGNIVKSILDKENTQFAVGGTSQGTKILKDLFNKDTFKNPKTPNLIKLVVHMSTKFINKDIVLDFFAGSGTTGQGVIDLNRKDNGRRKYLLIEMGNYFNTVLVPRIKKVCFSDKWKDGKAQEGQGISQFFKYYKFEQYEDTLRNMKYKDNSPNTIFDNRKAFEQYVFYADQKFAHVLDVQKKSLEIDFDKLYPNIDFAETLSNLLGLPIKKITKNSVILQDGESEKEIKTDYKNMNESEKLAFVRLLKPALWWGA